MNHLFLDLEGTWVESFDRPIFLNHNIEKISKLKGEFDSITIFSFAVHEFSDLLPMNFVKKDIERVFLTEVGVIPKNVLIHSFRKHFKFHMSVEDFHDFSNNKGMSFQIHMMEKIKEFGFVGDSFVLIDDMVDDMEMSFKGNKIKTINVESM